MSIYQNFKTNQSGINEKLAGLVLGYTRSKYLRPISPAQLATIKLITSFAQKSNKPIIIDSGCGTGLSTTNLAKQYPDHTVVGIDRSAARISRAVHTDHTNYIIVRGDLVDIWRLLAKEQLPITHHFLFYPNPYPKMSQLKRRFYANPVFSTMVDIAKYFELRTNWSIYADECMLALKTLGYAPSKETITNKDPISLFEKKYIESNCPIFVVKNQNNERNRKNDCAHHDVSIDSQ